NATPGSLASARIALLAHRALAVATDPHELEPATLTDAQLLRFARPPSDAGGPVTDTAPSDARWFWIAALILLVAELPLRRRAASPVVQPGEDRARAA